MIYWIRQLFTNGEGHKRAFAEVSIVGFFTLIPSIVTYYSTLADKSKPAAAKGQFELTENGLIPFLDGGDLYFLGYAIFGTLFWLSFIRWDNEVHAARKLFGTASLMMVLLLVGFMGIDPELNGITLAPVKGMGIYFYISMNLIYYLLLFIQIYALLRHPTFSRMGLQEWQLLTASSNRENTNRT